MQGLDSREVVTESYVDRFMLKHAVVTDHEHTTSTTRLLVEFKAQEKEFSLAARCQVEKNTLMTAVFQAIRRLLSGGTPLPFTFPGWMYQRHD